MPGSSEQTTSATKRTSRPTRTRQPPRRTLPLGPSVLSTAVVGFLAARSGPARHAVRRHGWLAPCGNAPSSRIGRIPSSPYVHLGAACWADKVPLDYLATVHERMNFQVVVLSFGTPPWAGIRSFDLREYAYPACRVHLSALGRRVRPSPRTNTPSLFRSLPSPYAVLVPTVTWRVGMTHAQWWRQVPAHSRRLASSRDL
jgi:hypothetical protein